MKTIECNRRVLALQSGEPIVDVPVHVAATVLQRRWLLVVCGVVATAVAMGTRRNSITALQAKHAVPPRP